MGRGIALLAGALLALAPASASAATLQSSGSVLQYRAAAGEVNQLTITLDGSGNVVFTDAVKPVVQIDPTAPCVRPDANQPNVASCPAAGVTSIDVDTGDMNDSVDDQAGTLPATLAGGAGRDDLRGGDQNDLLDGGDGTDALRGRGGDDFLRGGTNTDTGPAEFEELIGGEGNDRLQGGPGRDDLNGQGGVDTADYSERTAPVTVTMGDDAVNDGEAGEGDAINVLDESVENVTGGSGNDSLTGDVRNNRIDGGDGQDTIDGGDGVDTVDGGPGNDIVRGGPNPDPSPGFEEVHGGPGDDLVDGGPGRDDITGDEGTDTVDYSSRTGNVTLTLGDHSANDGEAGEGDAVNVADDSVEDAQTGSGNDTIIGTDRNEILVGGAGNDHIDGLAGSDEIDGFAGNDDLTGGDANDVINGQAGDDTIRARDGVRDEGDCGDGNDTVYADTLDAFGPGCETVTRRFVLRIRIPAVIRIPPSGLLPIRIGCPDGASLACIGVLRLASLRPIGSAANGRLVMATKRFRIAPGKSQTIRVRLTKRGRALVKKRGRVRVRATITSHDAQGKMRTVTKTLTLRGKR